MSRALLILALLLPPALVSQQPDVKLRLLTLYKVESATLVPIEDARLRVCATCAAKPFDHPLQISASDAATNLSTGGAIRIQIANAPPRTVRSPLSIRVRDGQLLFITTLPFEEYVASVVQGETSGDMPDAALTAMAIAARSYATHYRERHKNDGFEFCDTTHCQFAKSEISPQVRSAVEKTRGEMLWKNGRPVAAYYHRDCGGKTEADSDAWPTKQMSTPSHEDPFCVRTSKPWQSELLLSDVDAALKSAGLQTPRGWNNIRITQRTGSGRARTLQLVQGSSSGGIPVSASSFRFAVGRALGWNSLKSNWFEVSSTGDRLIFKGRGTGHGVGMCQTGAIEMARLGKSYREILNFYYPDTSIGISAAGIAWRRVHSTRVDLMVLEGIPSDVTSTSERALTWAESRTGFAVRTRPAVYVFPSVEMFRNATGEPGWVAASTRGNKVRLQPVAKLGMRAEEVLKHEFVHLLLEQEASREVPLWYREGLALLLTGETPAGSATLSPRQIETILQERRDEASLKRAYDSAGALVARLEREHGRATLLQWLRRGLPSGILSLK